MNKNNNWLIWVIAVVAIVALVLSIVAVNITGNAIFGFGKKSRLANPSSSISYSPSTYGVLGAEYLNSGKDINDLRWYEVKYDSDGNLVYEIFHGEYIGNYTSLNSTSATFSDTSAPNCKNIGDECMDTGNKKCCPSLSCLYELGYWFGTCTNLHHQVPAEATFED